MKTVIQIEDMKKVYHVGDQKIEALRGVNLTIGEGEFVAIMGPSGSGKSTMMNMIGCLDLAHFRKIRPRRLFDSGSEGT